MAFCSQCGERLVQDAAFCTACGKPVQAPEPPIGDQLEPAAPAPDPSPPTEAATPTPQPATTPPEPEPTTVPAPQEAPSTNTRPLLYGGISAVVIVVIVGAAWFVSRQGSDDAGGVVIPVAQETIEKSTSSTTTAPTTTAPTTTTTAAPTTTTTTLPPTTTTTLPADLVAGLEGTGTFVATGSNASAASLEESVGKARNQDWDLSVIALPAEPEEGFSPLAGSIASELNLGTVVAVGPDGLGWASQETQFYDGEFERAWGLIPPGSNEDQAVDSFVRSVLGGPDSVGAVDPSTGEWILLRFDGERTTFTIGEVDDTPTVGDWSCNGITTPGVWRPSLYQFFDLDAEGNVEDNMTFTYENDDVIPLAGDFDGSGCDSVSFYHKPSRQFTIYAFTEDDLGTEDPIDPLAEFVFGATGDIPFVGDFDGDGIDTIGLYRPSTATVYLKNSFDGGPADREFPYGSSGDLPIAGDWGPEDGIDTIGVYRPDTGNFYLRYENAKGPADETIGLDVLNAVPVAGPFGLDRSG